MEEVLQNITQTQGGVFALVIAVGITVNFLILMLLSKTKSIKTKNITVDFDDEHEDKLHNIKIMDIEILANYYTILFDDIQVDTIKTHILGNTKEFMEHCLDQNSIAWDNEDKMKKYIAKVSNYVHSHFCGMLISRNLITKEDERNKLNSEQFEALCSTILLIMGRNK